jgi:uncharacterized protein (DUF1330 family)
MAYYVIGQVNLKDDSWVPEYVANVTSLVERYGGRYLARSPNVERLEGDREPPHLCGILEFPSRDAAMSFYESAEYSPFLRARQQGASTELILVPGGI